MLPAAACWLIVNALPAIVTVAVRLVVEVLAATVIASVALPVPLLALSVTHVALDDACQLHVLVVVIVACVPPPAAGSVAEVGEMENEHEVVVNVNSFDGSLSPVPVGPTAATRAS